MNVSLLLLGALLAGADPKSGEEVVRAMHDRYAGNWYHTLSFVQHNTAYLPGDSLQHSTWFERMAVPGMLRIDFREGPGFPPTAGLLFARDSQFIVSGDTLANAMPFIHPLMVLGFDVYSRPIDSTLARLRELGFDLAVMHEDTWQGRPAYVVGAPAGDRHTRQFWVDRERLVFVRMLEPSRRDTSLTTETQFNDYRPAGRGWVSARVVFLIGGERRWMEEYADIETDVPLPAGVFDLNRWKQTK